MFLVKLEALTLSLSRRSPPLVFLFVIFSALARYDRAAFIIKFLGPKGGTQCLDGASSHLKRWSRVAGIAQGQVSCVEYAAGLGISAE